MKKSIYISLILAGSLNALTLQETIFKVSQENPFIIEKKETYEEAKKDLDISKSEWLPSLDLQSSVNYKQGGNFNKDVNDKGYESFSSSLKLTQNIFNGFSTTEKINYQMNRVMSAYHHYIETLNDVSYQTTQAFIEVIKMKDLLKNAEENLAVNAKIFADVSELLNAGLTTKSEMTKIKASYSLAEANVIVAKNNLTDKKLKLERLYGEPVDIYSLKMPEGLKIEVLADLKNNPSLLVSEYNIKSNKHLTKEKESKYLPIINIEAEQAYNDSKTNVFEGPDDRSRIGLTLNWNLYKGGADKLDIEKSKISVLKEGKVKERIEKEIIEQSQLSYAAHSYLGLQLIELEKYKNYSEETLDSYKSEYEMGRRTLLDLLSAQNDVVSSKSQIINAKMDRLFATYRIADASGKLVTGILDSKDYISFEKEGYKLPKTSGEIINEALK